MSIEKYLDQLNNIEHKLNTYKQDLDNLICSVSSAIHHSVVSKGELVNSTPYFHERMGIKINGKVLQSPIISDDCIKHHYDNENRLIMVEEYSTFLKKFLIRDIYLYKERTERLYLSSGKLARLFVFDNAFSNTKLCLSFAGLNGYCIEEFIYDDGLLKEIKISRDKVASDHQTEIHKFVYEGQNLVQIERVCQNGYRELNYTTKKPNFSKIKEEIYHNLKKLIANYGASFSSFGIEGFIDQQKPMFCVCFTEDNSPSDLLADWNVKMYDVGIYDWQLNHTQEKRCAKIIAEIIVELVEEGLLKDKQIYFHQNQVCVTQVYPGVKSLFKKANIEVK